ncbi:MAG: hypothetical protein B7C24_15275 [Bacteroidetes bacterium 4572_77]|nr:MAG: hypothetical protein B7C24_15275 [Bacteroidetes bacterium 4572_77]
MMKKITLEEFDLMSEAVKKDLLKQQQELETIQLPNISTKYLTSYEASKKQLQETFQTNDTDLIIDELLNCLNLSEKVALELFNNNEKLLDSQSAIYSKSYDVRKNSDLINNIYVNSIEKYTEKLLLEKGKGGRSSADYRQYEEIIIKYINKYLDSPRRDRYTISKAIEDISKAIEAKDGTVRSISDSTFKTWKKYFEETGSTIYKP